ncbi:vascular endothelial growth factor receptor 1-like [Centruroides vittatus]|uniref:vascular endothelial growth factor receptor 1-like n=1 Tax=Centruroides vittatus TaxID=120091 RepID=UPI00350FBA6F
MNIVSGSNLSLSCRGNGKLYWIFPDHSIYNDRANIRDFKSNDSYQSDLKIENVNYNDTGIYQCCFASRYFGFCDSRYIFVNDEEHLILPTSDLIIVYGQRKSFIPCRPTFSDLEVTLWRRGEYVKLNKNMDFDPTKGFILTNATSFFSDFFQCKAGFKNNQQSLTLKLYYVYEDIRPPSINLNRTVDIRKGSSIEIKCNGEKSVYWNLPRNALLLEKSGGKKFREDAENRQEISIRIENAQVSDSGPYMCCYRDYNDCHVNSTASYVFLRVNDRENLNIPEVETVIVEEWRCASYVIPCLPSFPDVTVRLQFRHNSSEAAFDCQNDFSYVETLGFVPLDDRKVRKVYQSGTFVCRYIYGNVTQEEEKSITPLDPRYSLQVWTSNSEPYENDQVEIGCRACKFAFRSIQWKKNGKNPEAKSSDENTEFELKKVLKFQSMRKEDAGTYECVGITQDNLEEREEARLKVKAVEKPSLIETNMNGSEVTLDVGKRLELACVARGEPQPIITWYRNNETLNETDLAVDLDDAKLTLARIGRSHSGTYQCRAENKGGAISAQLTVNVNRVEGRTTEVSKNSITLPLTIICVVFVVGILVLVFLIIRNRARRRYFR